MEGGTTDILKDPKGLKGKRKEARLTSFKALKGLKEKWKELATDNL